MRTAIVLFGVMAGCTPATSLPRPLTAETAVADPSGDRLVTYLAQPDASAAVCDRRAAGAHVGEVSPAMRSALVAGLRDGAIRPDVWRSCVSTLLGELAPDEAAALADGILSSYLDLARDKDLDRDPAAVERLQALHRVYLDRDPQIVAHATTRFIDELRTLVGRGDTSRTAARFGTELLDTIDIQAGTWHGRRVDIAMLDELAAAGNEMTLRRFEQRLPAPALRTEARRRIIRIHVALSPFPEVRDNAAAIEDRLLATGSNPVDFAAHPMTRLGFGDRVLLRRDVVVRQHIWQRSASLIGKAPDRDELSPLPAFPLHGVLVARVDGIAHAITTCASPSDLDPSPCIPAAALRATNPLTRLDGSSIIIDDEIDIARMLPLTSEHRFPIGVRAFDLTASLDWSLRFEAPEPLVFTGAFPGGRGPDLLVRVGAPDKSRVSFDVNSAGHDYVAIVETADLRGYRVASIGGNGTSGSDGSNGSDGSSGAECQNGGDGGSGSDGGSGGSGGNGGDIAIQLACTGGDCEVLRHLVGGLIVSEGGRGGSGGSGGRGGHGGSGGSSRMPTTHVDASGNTVTDDAGCSAGMSGSDGRSGSDGSSGSSGSAGAVRW